MSSSKKHQIQFFSKEDLSAPYFLKIAEEILDNFQEDKLYTLNELFEFYNIKLFFDNGLYLTTWSEKRKHNYHVIIDKTFDILKRKIIKITDYCLELELKNIEYIYINNFWNLVNQFKVYKNFSSEIFFKILNNNKRYIHSILLHKGIVDYFDNKIKEFLIGYENTAEILLTKLEKDHSLDESPQYFFPKSLSLFDKEKIIDSYLERNKPNLNYVRLIENSKDSNDLILSPKTRLKAKKKSIQLNSEISESEYIQNVSISIRFDKNQLEHVICNHTQEVYEIIYSEKFLNTLNNNIQLFHVFSQIFIFLDEKNLISLVNKTSELGLLERLFMKSKNAYEIGEEFRHKEILSELQLLIFEDYLKRNNNSIENIINSFIEYLNTLIFNNKLVFKVNTNNHSYIEKIRTLAPDYEFLLKQFKLFVDEKEIDLELIQINSFPIRFSEIHSLNNKKYIYINDNHIHFLIHHFYSDQSLLYNVEPYENKYNNLYDLLLYENLKLVNFKNFQRDIIEKLIDEKYLKVDNQGFIKLYNEILIFIIGELYRNEVLSYWNYSEVIRREIDILLDKGLLKFENTLLTVQEREYLNFYLNKKEFTNGYDLRNKYLHGTNSFSKNEHHKDYYSLLKIIILTLLKIEDDILIYYRNK